MNHSSLRVTALFLFRYHKPIDVHRIVGAEQKVESGRYLYSINCKSYALIYLSLLR